ncbi:MAG: pyrroline-5-carboxylate reductase [Desulfobacteraceae bacterium]|nr:pyrroline-5-carboxylate reductase [Desulfobacteraceae bacterium]
MFEEKKIGFIGGGNMGEALIRGLLAASLFSADKVSVYEVITERVEFLTREYGIGASKSISELADFSDILVLAVKPQVISSVLSDLRPHLSRKTLVISIAAGVPLTLLQRYLPEGTPVVRVMPNTPALVQEGASALAAGACVTPEQMQMGLALFRAVGKAVEVDEKMMDAVTGLSGSGPAYILLIIEALTDAAVLMGMARPTARELVVQTVLGTAAMVQRTGKHPAELKDMITSPGGTTIYGLQILEESAVRGALIEAVQAATIRSAELGKG